MIGTTIVSLLLVGSIVVLYLVNSMTTRLIAIAVFTAVFSIGSGFLTNGKMVEIFSATAAYVFKSILYGFRNLTFGQKVCCSTGRVCWEHQPTASILLMVALVTGSPSTLR